MIRLALLVLALAFAVLAGPADVAADVAESACCPCDDADDDGCCSAIHCPCVPHVAADVTPTLGVLPEPLGGSHPSAWVLLSEELARDRRSAPPTRPPIA